MSVLELRIPSTGDSEYFNIAETWNEDCTIPFMHIIVVLKEEMNEFLKEIYENTNRGRNE